MYTEIIGQGKFLRRVDSQLSGTGQTKVQLWWFAGWRRRRITKIFSQFEFVGFRAVFGRQSLGKLSYCSEFHLNNLLFRFPATDNIEDFSYPPSTPCPLSTRHGTWFEPRTHRSRFPAIFLRPVNSNTRHFNWCVRNKSQRTQSNLRTPGTLSTLV